MADIVVCNERFVLPGGRVGLFRIRRAETNNIEKAVLRTGFGLYHKFLIGLTALSYFSEAIILTTLMYVIPLMACDIPLSENMIISVNVVYSIGEALGGFAFCAMSDIFGRKYLIPILSALIFASTLACSFVHGSMFLFIFLMCLGSGLSANTSIMKIHLAEILPMYRRGMYLVFVNMFWTCGYFISTAMAWGFSPLAARYYNKDARFFTWRVMCALSSIFSILIGCASNLIKPSIRFLLYSKRHKEALNTLKEVYAINNSKNSEDFKLNEITLHNQIHDYGIFKNIPIRVYFEHMCALIKTAHSATVLLISKKFVVRFMIMIYMKMVTCSGIIMAAMWMYKLLQMPDNCYIHNTDILYSEIPADPQNCTLKLEGDAYRDTLLLGINVLVGQFIAVVFVDTVCRKYLIVLACTVCGMSNFIFAFIRSFNLNSLNLGLVSAYLIFFSVLNTIIDVVIVEIFPTAIRGTAIGETQFFLHLTLMFIKKYFGMNCKVSLLLAGTFTEIAAVLALFLPEFKGRPMME
ncbi:Major Facilitator Superfamily [Popillia japonica]|uniref:Major Facilitator Superfamily n=1 Tax=Popillia japonica TaxID=7064 RepID=A0AAW1I6Y5_POPJA